MNQIDESKIKTFFILFFAFVVLIVILSNTKYDFYSAEEIYSQGVELYNSGKYFEAIQKMNKIIEKIPSYQKAYILKGKSYMKIYLEHSSLNSSNFSGTHRREDFLALAKTNFETANEIKDNAEAHYYLGLIYYLFKDTRKSIFHAEKALSLDPKMKEARELLIKVLKIHIEKLQKQIEELERQKAIRRMIEEMEKTIIWQDEHEYLEENEDYNPLLEDFNDLIIDDDDDDGEDDEIEANSRNYEESKSWYKQIWEINDSETENFDE